MGQENKQTETVLSVKNLSVEYSSDGKVIHAVNGITFSMRKGETLGLVGETGAGKTTVAQAILQILSPFSAKIRSGEIWYENQNLLTLNEAEMRKIRGQKSSMVFQDPMTALNPVMRVGNQIAEAIRYHENVTKKEAEAEAKKMLELVGISADRYRDYPHQFSGGMKQRIVIAMALACNPELLLADEPTTALDVTIQAQVLKLISNLKEDNGTSVILITHDLGIVAGTCDSVAVVYAGNIVEYGTKEEIFDHPVHPYTLGLFHALPDINKEVNRLQPIAGMPPDPSDLPSGCSFAPRCPYAEGVCRSGEPDLVQLGGQHICKCRLAKKEEK